MGYDTPLDSCPDEILAAIPWYPNELDDESRGRVESHASQCAACRDELAFVHGDAPVDVDLDSRDRAYARLLSRIEDHEQLVREPVPPAPTRVASGAGARVAWPIALAAGLALALLSGGIGAITASWLGTTGAAPVYETVSDARTAVPATVPSLDVVFRTDATAEAIHEALRAVGGQIVAGPTQLGVYRVELSGDADLGAAARALRGDGNGVATFAEPAVR